MTNLQYAEQLDAHMGDCYAAAELLAALSAATGKGEIP